MILKNFAAIYVNENLKNSRVCQIMSIFEPEHLIKPI